MLRRLIEVRMLIALAIAAGVGIGGLRAFPIRSDHRTVASGIVHWPGARRRTKRCALAIDLRRASVPPHRSGRVLDRASLAHDRRDRWDSPARWSAVADSYPRFQAWLRAQSARRFSVFVSVTQSDRSGRPGPVTPSVRSRTSCWMLTRWPERAGGNQRATRPTTNRSYIVHSSPNRLHVLWRVTGFTRETVQKHLRGS